MDYVFTTVESDGDNVGDSFAVLHGFTEHWFDLGTRTYTKYRKGSNIVTETTVMVWDDNIPKINQSIQTEINRLNALILQNKARLYEITNFTFLRVTIDETPKIIQDSIDAYQSTVTSLKNYKP